MAGTGNITISKENYLKAIAEAEAEGDVVIAATLSRWLNVSPPAVTTAIRRLKRDGYITVEKKGGIALTSEGRQIADRVLHRHHLIERMLVEIFGMEWFKVHEEAERLEHAVSADFEELLTKRLGPGRACPHGNDSEIYSPAQRRQLGWMPLDEVEPARVVKVMSVYERDRDAIAAAKPVAVADCEESLALSKDDSDRAIQAVASAVDEIQKGVLQATDIAHLAIAAGLPEPFANVLRVLAAESERRCGRPDHAARIMSDCTNATYGELWQRWSRRVADPRNNTATG